MSKIDYVFLDGGHDYQTVKNDLDCCKEVIVNGGTVLCDDYDLSYAPGVKKAIDEFSSEYGLKCSIICNDRFAKIMNKIGLNFMSDCKPFIKIRKLYRLHNF